MSSEHEPDWMRDKRLRDEEARMVRVEEDIRAIKEQTGAIKELFDEERRVRRRAEERLEAHETSDNQKFSSIDSRLMGTQTQLTSIAETLNRIEGKVEGNEHRLGALEDVNKGQNAVQRFVQSAWVQFTAGVGLAGTLIGIYLAVA